MDVNSVIGTGAILAGMGTIAYSLFNQLKSLPALGYKKLKQRFVFNVKIYQYDELFEMLETWLSTHHQKQYRDVEAVSKVSSKMQYSKSSMAQEGITINTEGTLVSYKQEDNTFIIKYKKKKLFIVKSKEKLDKAQNLKDIWFRKYSISGWRAQKHIDALLKEAISLSKKVEEENTITVYSNSSYGDWQGGSKKKVKSMDKTILNANTKTKILNDVGKFLTSEKWYTDVCIPYKRGFCLYGPPGTGKTTLALALATYTHRNIYSLNLNALDSDTYLPRLFSSVGDNSIILIEDIDKVFSGRDNVDSESKISFSCLLNCLDGVFYKHGVIVIITTNHIDKLDEALLRTGRIDVKVEIPLPSDREISEYLSLFYQTEVEVYGNFNVKMSDVQEICLINRDSPLLAMKEIYSHEKVNGHANQSKQRV